ncbi:MAG TPA: DUF5996 family protein [Kofleriaceae bacterium]|nr:DUF5996 family protein [Kofleriaceae bacterium]
MSAVCNHSGHWPDLPLADWEPAYRTLHLWTQILGKTRLALAPWQNHWWHAALYVSTRGLTTSPMPYGDRWLELELDLVHHALVAIESEGAVRSFPLVPMTVADFYEHYLQVLRALDAHVPIRTVPAEVADQTRFEADRHHASYDASAAHRCWQVLARSVRVLDEYRGRFLGKTSPVHFWWGAFDLACTRFSGRPAPRHPGGVPYIADRVVREAYSHECMSVGWWPGGTAGEVREPVVREPAFYAYVVPEPPGYANAAIQPTAAYYHPTMYEWLLPYEAIRTAEDPDRMLLDFCQSAYAEAARLGRWDRAALEPSYTRDEAHASRSVGAPRR